MNLALRIAFIERGTRQIEAATALGWDPSKLSKFVNGWREPNWAEKKALASYLGKSETDLFPNPTLEES